MVPRDIDVDVDDDFDVDAAIDIQSALRAKNFQFFLFCRVFSAFWLGTSTERNVGDVEIYRLSKFQVRTTLGGRKNAEKRKSTF